MAFDAASAVPVTSGFDPSTAKPLIDESLPQNKRREGLKGSVMQEPTAGEMLADVIKSALSGVPRGAANLVGLPQDLAGLVIMGMQKVREKVGTIPGAPTAIDPLSIFLRETNAINAPKLSDVVRSGYRSMGLLHEPETAPGRYAGAISEGAMSFPLNRVQTGVNTASFLGGEAGQDMGGTAGRVVGSLIAPGVQLASSVRAPVASLINDATKGMTPAEWNRAIQLQRTANATGNPLTGAEATGNKALLAMQLVAEQSPKGSPLFQPFMTQRPDQAKTSVNSLLELLSPSSERNAFPRIVGARGQAAAEQAVRDAESVRTGAVTPLYQAAGSEMVAPERISGILATIDAALAADKTGILRKQGLAELRDILTAQKAIPSERVLKYEGPGGKIFTMTDAVPERPITDINNLDRARKYMRDTVDARMKPYANQAIDKESASTIGDFLKSLNIEMENASSNFLAGKRTFQDYTPRVDLREKGLAGEIAGTAGAPEQAGAIISPKLSRANEIRQFAADMRSQDPTYLQDVLRVHIENSLDSALKTLQSGKSEFAGAKLNAKLRSTPQMAENLDAALRELPLTNGRVVADEFKTLLDVFEAQGRRLQTGSRTAFNQEIQRELERGGIVGTSAATAASPGTAITAARDFWDSFRYGLNSKELAQVLTRPDSVEALRQLAKVKPDSARAAAIVGAMFAGARAPQGEQQ